MLGAVVRVFTTSFRTSEAVRRIVNSFWNRRVSTGLYPNNGTHLKDLKYLVEVQLPGGDRLLVAPGAETPREGIPSTPLD